MHAPGLDFCVWVIQRGLLAQDVSRKLGLSEQNLESTCASILFYNKAQCYTNYSKGPYLVQN